MVCLLIGGSLCFPGLTIYIDSSVGRNPNSAALIVPLERDPATAGMDGAGLLLIRRFERARRTERILTA